MAQPAAIATPKTSAPTRIMMLMMVITLRQLVLFA